MGRRRRTGGELDCLEWAVGFAQDDLTGAALDRWRREIEGLIGLSPTTQECQQVRERFTEILSALADTGRAVLGHGTIEVWRDKKGPKVWTRPAIPAGQDVVILAVARLGTALAAEGHRIKRCLAPRGVGESNSERCGRLFVGRPNQNYCGERCGNRSTTRASRLGRDVVNYRGHVIRAQPVRLGDRWTPAVEVETPEGVLFIEPNPIVTSRGPVQPAFGAFPTRHRAVRRGIEMAKRLIEARRARPPR